MFINLKFIDLNHVCSNKKGPIVSGLKNAVSLVVVVKRWGLLLHRRLLEVLGEGLLREGQIVSSKMIFRVYNLLLISNEAENWQSLTEIFVDQVEFVQIGVLGARDSLLDARGVLFQHLGEGDTGFQN